LGLSEDAKLAYLQEKIEDAKRNERLGPSGIVMGGVFVGVGIVFNIIWNNTVTMLGGISLIALGIFFFVFGIYVSGHYAGQYKNLMKELESMATSFPKCTKCGKELPKGNFVFCPFCGASLKP
jgi:uncharacterized membrane protein YedE/YeeE